MKNETKIAQFIKRVRVKAGLTQKQFGDLIGKKRDVIAKYETGKAIPPGDVLLRIQSIAQKQD